MHLVFRDLQEAFHTVVRGIHEGTIKTIASPSRYGPVRLIPEPTIFTYTFPTQRVLINSARDCNPFMFLYESLWMLAGRKDVVSLSYYTPRMKDFSDDGAVFHGAYGYRWRHHFDTDQITTVIKLLKQNKEDRRIVLTMWDPRADLDKSGKDFPCNTQCNFLVNPETGKLDMMVCNRSNDLIWGTFGANAVHMSCLLEYVAACSGLECGKYHQQSMNSHYYTENKACPWFPEKWLEAEPLPDPDDPLKYVRSQFYNHFPLVKDPLVFDQEVVRFVEEYWGDKMGETILVYKEPFLDQVARPMCMSFFYHRNRDYKRALSWVEGVRADDWKLAATQWLTKRKINWESKEKESSND